MYPRISSRSQLWEGVGTWDALVPTPSSLQNGVGSGARGECLYILTFLHVVKSKTLAPDPTTGYSIGFREYSIECDLDSRFKIQGAREKFALHLES